MEMLWTIVEVLALLSATMLGIIIWALLPEHWQGIAIIAYVALVAMLVLWKAIEWSVA